MAHSEIVDRFQANVWFEDVLLVIDPETGKVEKEYGTSLDICKVVAFVKLWLLNIALVFLFQQQILALYGRNQNVGRLEQMCLMEFLWPKTMMSCMSPGRNGIGYIV